MTFQIADAKSLFEDKEHYLTFRKAWSESANDENTHLTGAHMLLYALLRGKDARSAFVPISRFNKLMNGHIINGGLYDAYTTLHQYCSKGWRSKNVDDLLKPFKGTITIEMFEQVMSEIKISPIYSDYGTGRKVAEQIWRYRNGDKIEGFDYHKDNLWDLIDLIETRSREEAERRAQERAAEKIADGLVKKATGEMRTRPIERKKFLGLF